MKNMWTEGQLNLHPRLKWLLSKLVKTLLRKWLSHHELGNLKCVGLQSQGLQELNREQNLSPQKCSLEWNKLLSAKKSMCDSYFNAPGAKMTSTQNVSTITSAQALFWTQGRDIKLLLLKCIAGILVQFTGT